MVAVPGGVLDAVTGNLYIARNDLEIDTQLGIYQFGAVWNSADRRWRFGFEQSYRDGLFVDDTGARLSLGGLSPGAPVPGTHWTRVDSHRVMTRGGLVHVFDLDGTLQTIHFAGHAYPSLEFESGLVADERRVTAIRQCLSAADCRPLIDLEWDAAARLTGATDRAGRRVSYTWHSPGRLSLARNALAHERGHVGISYEYAAAGPADLVGVEWPEGERVAYAFGGQGRLLEASALGAGDLTFRAFYMRSGAGSESRLERPGGAVITWRADDQGRVVEVQGPVPGEMRELAWEGARIVFERTPAGVETHYGIDEDEIVSIRRGNLPPVQLTPAASAIDPANPRRRPLLEISDALGPILSREYGSDGLLASHTDGSGEVTTFEWSGVFLARQVGADARELRYSGWGEHGHPAQVHAAGAETQWVYDAVGNPLSQRTGEGSRAPGGEVSRGYDAARNLVELELAETIPIQPAATTERIVIERRSDGRVLALRRPYGADVTWHYDALGRLVEKRSLRADTWVSETRSYDAAGWLVEVARPNQMRTRWTRDGAGRTLLVSHWRAAVLEQAASLGWVGGRLSSFADSALGGVEHYAYDAAGRLSRVVFAGGEERQLAWDERSQLVAESFYLEPQGGVPGALLLEIERRYDGAGRMTEVRRDGVRALAFEREGGRVARITSGEVVRTLHVDAQTGFPAGEDAVDSQGHAVASSRVEVIREAIAGSTRVESTTSSLRGVVATSLERHRLYGSAFETGSTSQRPVGPRVLSFDAAEELPEFHAHDATANWLGNGVNRSGEYDAQRALLVGVRGPQGQVLSSTSFDAAGFATARDAEVLEWDAAGRIRRVGDRAAFGWDVRGRPTDRTLSGVETRFRFGGRVACDAAGSPRELDLGHVVFHFDGQADRHRYFDFRGNVKLVADAHGVVESHLRYGAFGVDLVHGVTSQRSFAGGIAVDELVLLGHRLLDPSHGRFLAPDPIAQLVNDFAYAQGNPVFYWDPTGASFEAVFAEYGGVAGSAAGATLGAGAALAYLNVAALSPAGAGAAAGGALLGYWAGSVLGAFTGRALDRAAAGANRTGAGDLADPADAAPAPGTHAPGPGAPPPPNRSQSGRFKGCVGACVGPARFHGPALSLSDSAVSVPSCAGPRFGESPDLRGWLPLLLPLCLVLTLASARGPAGPGRRR